MWNFKVTWPLSSSALRVGISSVPVVGLGSPSMWVSSRWGQTRGCSEPPSFLVPAWISLLNLAGVIVDFALLETNLLVLSAAKVSFIHCSTRPATLWSRLWLKQGYVMRKEMHNCHWSLWWWTGAFGTTRTTVIVATAFSTAMLSRFTTNPPTSRTMIGCVASWSFTTGDGRVKNAILFQALLSKWRTVARRHVCRRVWSLATTVFAISQGLPHITSRMSH